MMDATPTRRQILRASSAALAAMLADLSLVSCAFPGQAEPEELVPFLDMPRTAPQRLDWETLTDWTTPQDQVFSVQHYDVPTVDAATHTLEIAGLVENPKTFTMEQLKALPRKEQTMTMECSGNGSSKGFMNAVYNGTWAGTPLAPLLESCGVKPAGVEVVFYGKDRQKETLRKGTKSEITIDVQFGRSMSLADAMKLNLLLAWERDGKPIEKRNGAPLRLIVPGWYGIASVKWLEKIEVRDRRYMGRFMARDYVTVRGVRQGKELVYLETSVGRMNLKSVIARVTKRKSAVGDVPLKAYGAAWDDGTGVAKVEVQVDGGEWRPAVLAAAPRAQFSWTFFSVDLGSVKPGKHTLVSRATDKNGRVQPTSEDDEIKLKRTYWEAYAQWPREIEVEA
jgi:DMSO/TMAO reductase YedYZ molybdopterin-dependent catalytic subunit